MYYSKEKIQEIMEEKCGQWNSGIRMIKDGKEVSIFLYVPTEEERERRFPIPQYECHVFDDGDFTFVFHPKTGMTKLTAGPCGPVENQEHFENIQTQFEFAASILARYL